MDKIYDEKFIKTKLKREELKHLLELCTKEMHFTFNGETYKQVDGVAMGSPLGPVLANVFMVELETKLVPTLNDKIALWQRYVDDTFTFIKNEEIENVKTILNGFHEDIKFTHEIEKEGSIAFLDVKITRKINGQFITEVHRKKTDTNIYMNWKSFSPRSWKIGTLKGLFRRAFLVCSEQSGQNKEISFLKHVFTKINGYPSRVVNDTLYKVTKTINNEKELETRMNNVELNNRDEPKVNKAKSDVFPYMTLPYKGQEGEKMMHKLQGFLKNKLPTEVKPRIIYKGQK